MSRYEDNVASRVVQRKVNNNDIMIDTKSLDVLHKLSLRYSVAVT